MEITILCENASSDIGCLAEWGFSNDLLEHLDKYHAIKIEKINAL